MRDGDRDTLGKLQGTQLLPSPWDDPDGDFGDGTLVEIPEEYYECLDRLRSEDYCLGGETVTIDANSSTRVIRKDD